MASGELFGVASGEQRSKGQALLAHCDGGARGNPGPAGYGAVIADEHGTTVAELSEFLGNRTNNYAEYSGLLGVLAWTLEHGHRQLRVVSDSELMVKQIQGRYKVNSPDLRPLFEEARRRIAQLESFQITHALRHKNKDADRLANEAMDRGMNRGAPPGTGRGAGSQPVLSLPLTRPIRATPVIPELVAGAEQSETAQARGSVAAGQTAASPTAGKSAEGPNAVMLRGFVRDGKIHLLGGKVLPEGSFVKVLPE